MGTNDLQRFAALFCALFLSATVQAETMLVFDGSNSMWGEIDRVAKIEIAKDAVNTLLDDWNPAEPLGLLAYGHRDARSCQDIEVLAQPGSTFGEIRRAVQNVMPQGRTPLTDSLLAASRALKIDDAENPTVIVLTDGTENCQRDPCEVAAILKEYRADFRVHVIGFNVEPVAKDNLTCLSDQTGGAFFAADTKQELMQSMQEVAVLVAQDVRQVPKEPKAQPSRRLRNFLDDRARETTLEPELSPAKPSKNADDVRPSDPGRILTERVRETIAQSMNDQPNGNPKNPNATVFAFGGSQVAFTISLAEGMDPTFGFKDPTWTIYERRGQARGRQWIISKAQRPTFDLPVGDYFVVLSAENVRYNYAFSVTDTLPKRHVITLNLGALNIAVENDDVLDIYAFRFERGPENPSLDLQVRGPWSQTLLLPPGTYIVQGRMKDRRSTVGPLIIAPGQTTQARILVR